MDVDNLVSQIKIRFDHHNQKKILQEKYQAKMIFAYSEGLWQAGPELLNLLSCCNQLENVVIPDLYGNPTKIRVDELKSLAIERWQEQMTAWLLEYDAIKTQR